MAATSSSRMTLREHLIVAERLTQELIDHLERGFTPKLHSLRRLVRGDEASATASQTRDNTVRDHAKVLLEAEEFTDRVYKKLHGHFSAIDAELSRISTS